MLAVAYENGCVQQFQVKTGGDNVASFPEHPRLLDAHDGAVTCVRFVDEQHLASCGVDGVIRIWSLSLGGPQAIDVDASFVQDCRISPDGGLVLYTTDKGAELVDVGGNAPRTRISESCGYWRCAWSPSGDKLAMSTLRYDCIDIYDRQGRLISSIEDVPDAKLAFLPDGELLATANATDARLHRVSDGQLLQVHPLQSHGGAISFAHGGDQVALSESRHGITILSTKTWREVRRWSSPRATAALFSPDDKTLATGHGDSTIRLWDCATGAERALLTGHDRDVCDLAFSADGRTLLSSSADGTVRCWSVPHACELGIVYPSGARSSPTAACNFSLSRDERRLVIRYMPVAKGERRVVVWEL
jgi:WD40 repeat protein